MKPSRSNPLLRQIRRSHSLITTLIVTLGGFALVPAASAQSISTNFGANHGPSSITEAAKLSGAVPIAGNLWNNTTVNGGGTLGSLKDSTGATTTASVTWTAANTWNSGSTGATATSENGDLTRGYLDDSGTGWTVNMVSPYLLNDIYVIHATDQGNPAIMSAVSVNGRFYIGNGAGGTIPVGGSGFSWSAANFSTADTLIESSNYIRVNGQTGVSLAGLGSSPGRAAIAGLQVVNAYAGTLKYWDTSDATAGAGGATPSGVWNASNANWSSSAAGDVAAGAWTPGNAAVFAAGTDATGTYSVFAQGGLSADAVWAKNGTVTLADGGAGALTLGSSGILRGDTQLTLGIPVTATVLNTGGNVTLNSASDSISGLATISGTTTLGAAHSFGSLAGGGTLAAGANAVTVGGDNTNSVFHGVLTGSGQLIKTGSGRLTLGGNNTSTGATTVNGGTLRIGDGGNAGTVGGSITNNTTLEFLRNDTPAYNLNITGAGAVKFLGTNVSGQSSYDFGGLAGYTSGITGTVSVDDARLRVDAIDFANSGTITVEEGGQAWLQSGTYTRNFTLKGNGWLEANGQLGAFRLETGANVSGNVSIDPAGARVVAYLGSVGTISGPLSGGNLEVNFASNTNANGIVSLTGNNTGYTGTVNVSRGTLNTGALGGGLTVIGGTANLTGAVAGTTTLSSGTLNLNTGASVSNPVVSTGSTLGLGGGSISSGLTLGSAGTDAHTLNYTNTVAITGNLTASGTQTVNLVAQPPVGGTVTLLTYSGTASDPVDGNLLNNFVLAGAGTTTRSATFTDTGSAITLGVGNLNLTWIGADGTNPTFWNVGTTSTPNWSGSDTRFYNGDAVTFDDTATGTTVAMQSLLAPSAVTFNNTSKNFTVTGATGTGITGTTGLTKSGTGTLTLGGVGSTFTGAVAINGGVLALNNGEALGFNSGITIASGARLNFNGHAPANQNRHYTYTIAGDGGDGVDGVGAITTTGTGEINQNAGILNLNLSANAEVGGNNARFDIGRSGANFGAINGGGFTFKKVGSNSVVVRAPSSNITYEVNAGMLSFEDYDSASGSNPITVNGSAKVGSYGLRSHANNVTLNAGTTLISRGGDTATWTGAIALAGNANFQTDANLVIDGSLTGNGNITRAGGSTLFLQNSAASYSGKFTNNGGTLRIESGAALGTATGADVLTIGGTGGTTLQGGTFAAQASATIGSATQGITTTGNVTFGGSTGNTLTIDGAVAGTGNLTKNNVTGDTLVFNRAVNSSGLFSGNNGTLTFNGSLSLAGGLDVGTGIVTNLNSATATIGTGTYGLHCWTGTTNINVGTATLADFEVGNADSQAHTVNHSAGTLNVITDFRIGHYANETSIYNLTAGTINLPDTVTNATDESQANLMLGIDGTGVLNQSGGTINTTSLVLDARGDTTGTDTYAMTGGRLNLGKWGIRSGNTGSSKLIQLGGGILGASADWSSSLNKTLTGTGGNVTVNTLDAVDGTTARSITLSGALSGSGGLTKAGAGTLVLSGTNTYSGATAVNGGKLYLGGGSPTAVSLSAAGTLQTGAVASPATATIAELTLNGGKIDLRANYTAGDKFVVSTANGFTVPQASSVSVTPAGDLFVGDQITVIDYDGTIGGLGFAGLTLVPLANPHFSASLVDDTDNTQVKLQIDAVDSVEWTGSFNGTWDVNTTSNWQTVSDSTSSKFYDYDAVKFTDLGAATPTVTLAGTIIPSSFEVNAVADYTLQGNPITGNTGLVKSNTGKLTLLNNNTNLGTVNISGGTVAVGNGSSTGALGGSGNITLNSAVLEYNRSDAQTLARTITGGGGTFVKNGNGNLTMNAAGNTCDFTVNSGTMLVRGGNFSASFAVDKTITVNAGATLDTTVHSMGSVVGGGGNVPLVVLNGGNWLLNGEQYVKFLTMTAGTTTGVVGMDGIRTLGGSVFTINAAASSSTIGSQFNLVNATTVAVNDGSAANDLVVSGKIINTGILTKSGAGKMTFSGDNSGWTGGTELEGGTLEVSSVADAGGAGSLAKYDGSVVGAGFLGIRNDATFRYTGTGVETTTRNLWIDTGAQTKTLEVTSATGAITFSGTDGNINKPFRKTGAGALTINDVMNAGTVVTVDAGKLTLGGTNVYTGDTTVNATGTLVVDGDSIANAGKLVVNGSGMVQVTGTEVVDTLFIDGTQKPAGTYGATGSGATNIDNTHFSGSGVVSVTTGPTTGYGTWASTNAPTGTSKDDYDGDGVSNGVEWVLGGLATTNDLSKVPAASVSGGNLIFTFVRNDAAWTSGDTTVKIEVGNSLASWPSVYNVGIDTASSSAGVTVTPNGSTDTITLTVPLAPDTKKFARLKVEITP